MQARLVRDMDGEKGPLPAGTVIDHPQAFLLVQQGVAVPADEECAERTAAMTAEKMAAAAHAYERTERGIHPDDFEAYDRGEMVGYAPDGSWIPGPNYQSDIILTAEDY